MYSYEDRMRAVALYIKLGKRVKATMRALGYLGRATLTAWVHEAFPEAKRVSNGRYGPGGHTDAVKQAAVVGLYCRTISADVLAKKVGVSRPTHFSLEKPVPWRGGSSHIDPQEKSPFGSRDRRIGTSA